MSARRFTPAQADEIVRRYLAGENTVEIGRDIVPGRIFNPTTIKNTLKYMGVERRHCNPVVTDEQRSEAVRLCAEEGLTREDAAARVGVHVNTVQKALGEADVSLPTGRPREHEINDAAFDVLTPEALYWMGFLWADGSLTHDRYGAPCIALGLAAVDVGHVEKFRAFLGSTHAISLDTKSTSYGGGPNVDFRVRSKRLADALIAQGFAKKRTRTPTAALAESRDFWRGVIDGDGSVGMSGKYPTIKLVGQRPTLEGFCRFVVERRLAAVTVRPRKRDGLPTMSTMGSTARAVITCLYDGATVALDRKLARAVAIIRDGYCEIEIARDAHSQR